MALKVSEHAIDLSGVEYRDYKEEEVKGFQRVRGEYARLFKPILENLAGPTGKLNLPGVDFGKMLAEVNKVLELEEAEVWLETHLEQVSETRRAILHDLKPGLEQTTEVARTLAKADPQIDSLFAKLFDYLAEPQKKAASTLRKKEKQPAQDKE